MDTWKELVGQLRELREKRGISYRDLERLSGGEIGKSAIQRIENGERVPSAATLLTLARALNVRIVLDPDGARVVRYRRPRTPLKT